MAYQIDRYNKTLLTVVQDGTIDQTTDLKFIGKNYAGYGEIQNENFLFLLENFAGSTPPPKKISGQVWFDSSNNKLKFWDGSKWRTTGGSEVSDTQPTGLTEGDFWWDSANEQLYAWNGSGYVLIGPQAAGEGVTQMVSREVFDTDSVSHSVIVATVNGQETMVIAYEAFTIDQTDPENVISGFTDIKKGVTLSGADSNGVSATNDTTYIIWGTASDSLRLGGNLASDFVLGSDAAFDTIGRFPVDGIALGTGDLIKFYIDDSSGKTVGVIENTVDDTIEFIVSDNGTPVAIVKITPDGLVPSADNTFDIGTTNYKWKTVYANTVEGTATQANKLLVGASYRSADTGAVNNTIAARTSTGELYATKFNGTATSAQYADLAEKYTTNEEYPVGTIMAVCNHTEHETEAANANSIVIGVISDKPAYLMNSDLENGQAIGLKGRVPVRVVGPVHKGEAVYAHANGVGTSCISGLTQLVGVALESNDYSGEKLVECVLKV